LMLAVVMVFVISTSAPAFATPEQKRAEIQEILKLTGSFAIVDQIMRVTSDQMFEAMGKQSGQTPPAGLKVAIQDAGSKVLRRHFGTFLASLVAVYDKAYTDEEISAILAFYKSPAGIKSLKLMPQMLQASQILAQRWVTSFQSELQSEITGAIEQFQKEAG